MSLEANVSDICRRRSTPSSHAAALHSSGVDEDRRKMSAAGSHRRRCRFADYHARVAAYSADYWDRVDEAVRPAMIAHRRYVDRVIAPVDQDFVTGGGVRRPAAWLDFPRGLFNISWRRLPWARRRRQRQRRPSLIDDDDFDDTAVDFWMFLHVFEVDDTLMWKTRLRQRSVSVGYTKSNIFTKAKAQK